MVGVVFLGDLADDDDHHDHHVCPVDVPLLPPMLRTSEVSRSSGALIGIRSAYLSLILTGDLRLLLLSCHHSGFV